jgi:hypothetical protein
VSLIVLWAKPKVWRRNENHSDREFFFIKTRWQEYEEMLILDTPHNPSSKYNESSGFYYDKIYVNIKETLTQDWIGLIVVPRNRPSCGIFREYVLDYFNLS